jgi:reactive intermediate/imine deaminase
VTDVRRSDPDGVAAPAAGGYAHVVGVDLGDGRMLFVSGQLPINRDGSIVGTGDIGAQTRQVFENLRIILEAEGATFADVVKMGTYVTSLEDLDAVRAVRREYLGTEPPASTLVQVRALVVPEAMIEVDVIAVPHAR